MCSLFDAGIRVFAANSDVALFGSGAAVLWITTDAVSVDAGIACRAEEAILARFSVFGVLSHARIDFFIANTNVALIGDAAAILGVRADASSMLARIAGGAKEAVIA